MKSEKDWDERYENRLGVALNKKPNKVSLPEKSESLKHVISPSKKDWDEGDECGEHPVKVKVKVNMLSHHPRRIGTNEMSVGNIQ